MEPTSRKHITVAAAVITDGQGRLLATQRGYGEQKDGWEIPGGKIETGETPQEALVREIREELDADIAVGELTATVEHDYPAFHLTMHCYACRLTSGTMTLKEHEAARWLSADELDDVDWLPADRRLVPQFRRLLTDNTP